MTFCLKVISNCISIKHCAEMMLPYLETIMLQYCLPLLAFNEKDEEYWKLEPMQFIYSENCKSDDHNMLKNAAEELIKKIAEHRPQPKASPFIHNLTNFIFGSLSKMENLLSHEPVDLISKEYMLHALQATTDTYKLDKKIRSELEGFTETQLLPELHGDSDFLKYRSLVLYSRIGFFFEFKNKDACLKACQGISSCMASKAIPLKIAAAESMCVLLRNAQAREEMRNYLVKMIEIILELLNEVEYDGLINSLEAIIESFEKDIGPHSAKIIEGLGLAYYNYKGNLNANKGPNNEIEQEQTESERAASACLQTMVNLLKANLSQDIYNMCIDPILKIFNITLLENDEIDFQNSLALLNLLVYKNDNINDTLAFYFPILCYLIIGRPQGNPNMDISIFSDQMQEVLARVTARPEWHEDVGVLTACMMNFFQKCGDKFLDIRDCYGTSFMELTFAVIKTLVQKSLDIRHNHCLQFALKLMVGLMENFRGKIDNQMELILGMADELINMEDRSNTTISWLLSVISVAIWYNPELTFSYFAQKPRTLQGWFESFSLLTSEQDRDRKLFALSHILITQPDYLPKDLQMSVIMQEIFKTTQSLLESKMYDLEDDGEYNASYDSEYDDYYDDEDDAWSEVTSPYLGRGLRRRVREHLLRLALAEPVLGRQPQEDHGGHREQQLQLLREAHPKSREGRPSQVRRDAFDG